MIRAAFHDTAFAKADVQTQPKGNKTLVNLKTFYRASWTSEGYEPGEVDAIDPATMLQYKVDIRPNLVSVNFHFGDGASSGATKSLGGVYPNGDITHEYSKPGKYTTNVTVVFGGEYRIDGGAWTPIDETATVEQPGTVVTVAEANAVLTKG